MSESLEDRIKKATDEKEADFVRWLKEHPGIVDLVKNNLLTTIDAFHMFVGEQLMEEAESVPTERRNYLIRCRHLVPRRRPNE